MTHVLHVSDDATAMHITLTVQRSPSCEHLHFVHIRYLHVSGGFRRCQSDDHNFHTPAFSVAVLTEISRRSPRKIFIFIIKKIFTGSKYPINKIVFFEKKTSLPAFANFVIYALQAGAAHTHSTRRCVDFGLVRRSR